MEKTYSVILNDEYQKYIKDIQDDYRKFGVKLSVSEVIRAAIYAYEQDFNKSNKKDSN